MYSITHLEGASPRRIGSLASDPLGSLPRCDVVYESPAEFPWEGLPVGDGSTAGLLWTEPSSIIMALHRPDVWKCSEQSPSFGAWSWEREEKHGSQLSCGRLSFSDGMPSFDPYYLENFRQKIDTSTGCVELRASTPFSSWNMRAAGFSRYGVLAFSVQAEADEAVERRVSIERWGGRRFFHWYEQYVDDPHLHLAGMRSLADSDGIGVIQNLTCGASAFRVRIICDEGGLHPLTRVLNSRCVEYCFSPSEKSSFLVLVAVRTASGDDAEDCANAEACAAIEEAAGCADIFTEIKNEWRRFWSASFVRLEDRFLDTVYHQALYRMNSSFKAPLPSLFSGGAWAWNRDIRNWGHLYHWNQQQCYWGLHAAGHPELVSPWLEYRFRMLPRAIEDGVRLFGIEGAFFSDIADLDGHQAVEPDTVRNLGPTALVALDFHRAWLYGKDTTFLRERSYPVVQACARLFAGIFRREDDGYIRPFGGSSPFESYLVLRDNPVDRAAAEALFSAAAEEAEALGEFLAEEGHGEDYHAEAARWKNILRSLSPWCTTEEVFSDGILRRIFSAGRGADGKPLRYGEGTYPFSPFPAAQISPVFPFSVVGLDDAGSASPEARKLYEIALNTILLTVERDGKASGPLGFTAHTPLVQACARVGLAAEAYELIESFAVRYTVFPNGTMHFLDRNDLFGGRVFGCGSVRILSGRETATSWTELHEKEKGPRRPLRAESFIHAYLEPEGSFVSAVHELLLQDTKDGIRVFPAYPETRDAAFRLHAHRGLIVSSERLSGKTLFVKIEATKDAEARVMLPWRGNVSMRFSASGSEGLVSEEVSIDTDLGGYYTRKLTAGDSFLLFAADDPPEMRYGETFATEEGAPLSKGSAIIGKPRLF